ncbi:filamentous hemagglutinin N-terminal domain-containing protein [Janthinobacterium agaricidamnosum]|uniref:Filamentous hemagglutinin N-terminal domain-containing protein n=1 Tax=Janthinobacterium agaricidamnosum TaxID=55508 RepID=A0A3G2EHG4_9BURK|nr:filamentous hemagglutinin N-terminal domain-containing protein [Janthinobacterium agaricidamnosum]AYM79691.1 filamentous hemagglutinin N-terminal domain-containing protein [Janthinobacterium agaricidamnosum]
MHNHVQHASAFILTPAFSFPLAPPLRRTALALLLAGCFGAAQANPALPQVVNGQATFSQQGNIFSITNTPNTIINWQSFSIHAGEITRFIQQSGNSAVLNRITGQDPSKILGALESNGKVFLINPNGIVFGQGAKVDVNGLVASSLGMTNEDFLAGKRQFTAGGVAGGVSNAGMINAGKGGQVLLIAPNVENTGIITAPNGEVILAAGRSVQLADPGNPQLRVLVSAPADQALNLGQIIAQGGSIGMAGALVSQRGVLNANSAVVGENGRIVLKASGKALLEAGSVTSAAGAAGTGGQIQVLGEQVGLLGNAKVDASGATGGGTVLLGGDYQGKNAAVHNARQVLVGKDASVNADAIVSGNGGKVIAWGNESAQVHGSISARGGAQGGDGGFVETSGHYLAVDGIRVNTSAARGKRGNWLLDPYDIDVVQGPGGNLANVDQFSDMPSTGSTSIGADTISGATSDVTLQALHRINFSSSVNMLNSGVSLTAQAGETINVYAAITTNGGNVTLSANDPASTSGNYGPGSNVNLNAAITSNGGNISLSGASIEGAAAVHVGNGNLSLRANDALGGINLSGGAGQLAGNGIAGQTVTLQADNITVAGGIDVGGTAGGANVIIKPLSSARSIDLGTKSGTALSLNAVELAGISAASLTIGDGTNTGGLRISDALARSGDLHLNSGSAITATGAVTVGGSFVLDGGAWVQNAAALPGFSARNFTIGSGASFLRVAGGDGAATPYLLADIYGLQGIASLGLGNSYRLAGNIDASGTANWNDGQGFVPIAGSGSGFSGVFDGGGFTLSNLKIDRSLVPGPAAGLFGTVQGGTLRNLTLSGGSVTGRANVGALAGEVVSGTISGVNSSVAVSGQRNVGGLVGSNGGAITLSASSGAVTGVNADNGGAIGGLAGSNASGASIATSYATGVVTGAREMIGGLVGNNQGALSQSYATGNVSGARSIGGLVGLNGGSIDDAYASGAVGRAVTADPILSMENMGGLVGESTGSVSHVFSSGAVSGDGYASVGAVAGRVSAGSPFSYGFFNYETSLVQTGGGGSSGRSTAQMRQQGSFSDYNFSSVWRIYEGYTTPMLKAFLKPLQVNLSGNATGKVYDGQLAAFLGSIAYVGLIDGDTGVNGSLGYGSNARNVGSYAATGLWSTKYDITMGGTTTFAITPRTLNVQFNGVNKVYDGTTGAALGFGDDRVAGDRLNLSALASFSDKNAGAGKTVFVTNLSLGGADAGNYLLTSTGGTTQATIAQKQLSTWVGSGSGLWSDAANWDGGVVPEGANVLAVDFSNSKGIVTYSAAAGNTILKNLTASAGLLLTGGSLTLGDKAPDSSLLASLEINGGNLLLNGSLSADRYVQGGGVLSGNGNLLVANSFNQTAGAIRLAGQLAITQAAGDLRFASLAANDVQLSALNGAIGQDGALLASSLTVQARDGIVLSNAGNQVSSFSANNRAGGGIALNNTSAPGTLALGTLTTGAGNIAIDNTGGVTAGNIDANGGNVSVTAHSPVAVNGRIAGNDIALNAGTDVLLGDGAQLVAARDISLAAGRDISIKGNSRVASGGNFTASAEGNVLFADTASFTLPAAASMSVLAKTGSITGTQGVRINRQRTSVGLQAPNGTVSMADAIFLPVTTVEQPVIINVIINNTLNVIKQADYANVPLVSKLPAKPADKVPDDKDVTASAGDSTGLTKNESVKKMYCN